MPPIEAYTPQDLLWDERFSTGDKVLDDQHIYLIETINKLGAIIKGNNERSEIGQCLSVLKFYAGLHFEREEECMETYHCPAAEKNKKAHSVFINKIDSFQREFNQSNANRQIAIRIHREVTEWIVSHILVVDTQLNPCIKMHKKANHPSTGQENG